jgi:hypothetical protein
MFHNLVSEGLVGLREAAKVIPSYRPGKGTSVSCVLRWITKGVEVEGRRIRLEALRCGGRWCTSHAAIERFLHAQTPVFLETDTPPPAPRTPRKRERAVAAATAKLAQLGI